MKLFPKPVSQIYLVLKLAQDKVNLWTEQYAEVRHRQYYILVSMQIIEFNPQENLDLLQT